MAQKAQILVIGLLAFLLPLFFLPFTADFYEFNKQILLIFGSLLMFALWGLNIIEEKKFRLWSTPFDIPILLFLSLHIFSMLFQSNYKVGSLLAPEGVATVIFLTLLYFTLVNSPDIEGKKKIISDALVYGGVFLSLISLLWTFGLVTPFIHTSWLGKTSFSPAGSPLLALLFLFLPFSFIMTKLISYLPLIEEGRLSEISLKGGAVFSAGILLMVSTVGLIFFIIKESVTILPYNIGWAITLEAWKSIPSLFLGFGPGNFLTAFTLGKPVSFNSTPFWNMFFTSSSSFLFTLSTEVGIVAAIIFCFITAKIALRLIKTKNITESPLLVTLMVALSIQLFTLSNVTLLAYAFILLAIVAERREIVSIDLAVLKNKIYFLLLPPVLVIFAIAYLFGRVYVAEAIFKRSLDALATNSGQKVYQLQLLALNLNPYMDRYHISFSQTNLGIANALSSQKEITDADKSNIPRLVQQAIDEARTAVSLNRTNVVNWGNLAGIYNSIIRFANGADQWTIVSYQQIIALDPFNPSARLALGGVYYSLGRFDDAINLFSQAVGLKPDLANAHYNLASAYKQKKDYLQAFQEFTQTQALLPKDSKDGQKVSDEIDKLKPLLPKDASASATPKTVPNQSELTLPKPLPTVDQVNPTVSLAPPLVTPSP